MGLQVPGDSIRVLDQNPIIEQNNIDSFAKKNNKDVAVIEIEDMTDVFPESILSESSPKSKRNELYPAVGTLDKAFLAARDFCTTTFSKWDLIMQRMLSKIKKEKNTDTLRSN